MKNSSLAALLALVMTVPALADDSITLKQTHRVSNNANIHFDVPIGEISVETHAGENVKLQVVVKAEGDNWFSDEDVSDAELEIEVDGDDVYFSVNKEENPQEWQILLPESANIDLDVGVGAISIEGVEKNVRVDLGVGEINANMAGKDYRRIDLDSGVGEVKIDGLRDAKVETALVSESVDWRGEGEYKLDIEVGVGGIDVQF